MPIDCSAKCSETICVKYRFLHLKHLLYRKRGIRVNRRQVPITMTSQRDDTKVPRANINIMFIHYFLKKNLRCHNSNASKAQYREGSHIKTFGNQLTIFNHRRVAEDCPHAVSTIASSAFSDFARGEHREVT